MLYYHGVEESLVDREVQQVQMPLAVFERQIVFLRQHREVISTDDLHASLVNGHRLDPRQVVLTFDDGYKNNLQFAAPLLRSLNLPFTLFVSTRHISEQKRFPLYYIRTGILYTDRPYIHLRSIKRSFDLRTRETRVLASATVAEIAKSAPIGIVDALTAECMEQLSSGRRAELDAKFMSEEPMNWDDVRAVARLGATVGSHCHDHCILHERQNPEQIRRQLDESKAAIEKNVGPCKYLAYPNGRAQDISGFAYATTKAAQFSMAFSTIHGEVIQEVDRLLAPRIYAFPEFEEFCYLLNRSSRQEESYRTVFPPGKESAPLLGVGQGSESEPS